MKDNAKSLNSKYHQLFPCRDGAYRCILIGCPSHPTTALIRRVGAQHNGFYMNYLRNMAAGSVMVGLMLAMLCREASAYIDPGTGSYILQMVIAGIVGAGFAIKLFWKQIKLFIMQLFSKDRESGPDDASE